MTLHFHHLSHVVPSPFRLRQTAHASAAAVLTLIALALTAISSTAATNLLGGDDPLSPQEAFVPSVSEVSASSITLSFDIAEGYYLYRDKTSFTVDDAKPLTPSTAFCKL